MAIDFTTTQRYEFGSSVLSAYPFTFAAWVYPDTLTANRTIIDIGSTSNPDGHRIFLTTAGIVTANTLLNNSGYVASSTTGATTGIWQHACGVFAAANDRRAYLNGGNKGTGSTSAVFDSAVINRTTIAAQLRSGSYTQGMDGRIAEAAIWNAALSDDEVYSLSRGIKPTLIRPDNLIFYMPLVRNAFEYIEARGFTTTGSPTITDHPKRYG